MKLTILTDNYAGRQFRAEHGLSFYIEDSIKILFDTGHSDVFLYNAKELGISLQPDYVVLSHGHWDHGNGLRYLDGGNLVCHPSAFIKRYSKANGKYVGIDSIENIKNKFKLIYSEKPYYLTEDIVFLGTIPRITDFESKTTVFKDESGNDDFIEDDSALAIKTKNGIVLISGCAHAGICNTLEYAKAVLKENRISAIIGGFHLKSAGENTLKTIQYLKKNNVKKIYPSHCTSLPALSLFFEHFRIEQVMTGNYYNF
jgi:7,8-dihydropterin-6-yl-methyl-4-(beta-D-ribofuranosyl)aminobenzene 5'-phosphate synthase